MDNKNKDIDAEGININRRGVLKLGAFGGAAGAATLMGAGATGTLLAGVSSDAQASDSSGVMVTEHDDFPVEVAPDYQPYHQRNTSFNYYHDNGLFNFKLIMDEDRPGFTMLDHALANAGWMLNGETNGYTSNTGYDIGFYGWDKPVMPERYQFKSKQDAANAIKRAARSFGADLVGITHQDERWDYASFYDGRQQTTKDWSDFPFKPKTVIVMAFEMDYETQKTAPSVTADVNTSIGYANMSTAAFGVAAFLRNLGYHAVASGNDLGMNVPYGVAAGLGEASRMSILVTYNLGPRVRLAKVYTDLEFVEHDKPKTFGVREFCERCMRCSDACPSTAISMDQKPSLYPPEGHDASTNSIGVRKWYLDGKKCLQYWIDSGTNCGTCITACPYNKPDFWQHRMIEKMNSLMPGEMHRFMRQMDIWFGFGSTFNEDNARKFWDPKGRRYDGHS